MRDVPLLVAALTVSAYWLRVAALALRIRHHRHRDVGIVPGRPAERLLWLVFVPLVLAWCALPWLALTHGGGALAVPRFAATEGYRPLRWIGALAVIVSLVMHYRCWRRMGDDWRMDISDEHTALFTDGPFQRVRHPIYACGILMMLGTVVILPSATMIVVALIHLTLMNIKARTEEAQLARMHGDAWRRYAARTGRFVPRRVGRNS